jgi:hypothetical protein
MLGKHGVVTFSDISLNQACSFSGAVNQPWLDGTNACIVAQPPDFPSEHSSTPSPTPAGLRTETSTTERTATGQPSTAQSLIRNVIANPSLTEPTMHSSLSEYSSSSFSSSHSAATGHRNVGQQQEMANAISGATVSPRPQLSQLQQHMSTSHINNEQHPAQGNASTL